MSQQPLTAISPSRLADLLACPARVALQLGGSGGGRGRRAGGMSMPLLIGRLCHEVLEQLAIEEAFDDPEAFETAWSAAVARARTEHPANDVDGWPDAALTKARLRRTMGRIAALIQQDPGSPLPEQELTGWGGQVVGQIDLVVRGASHWIAELKTGRIREHPREPVRAEHVRQVQLYAYLEHEATGYWPTHAWLVTLQGRDARIELNPHACMGAATNAYHELEEFNRKYPDITAQPGADNCRWCRQLHCCPAPWTAEMDWGDHLAMQLLVEDVAHHGDEVWIQGQVLWGLDAERVTIDRLRLDWHPAAAGMSAGVRIAAVGLTPLEGHGDRYRLSRAGRVVLLSDAEE